MPHRSHRKSTSPKHTQQQPPLWSGAKCCCWAACFGARATAHRTRAPRGPAKDRCPPMRHMNRHRARITLIWPAKACPQILGARNKKCFILASTYSLKSLYNQLKERFRCFLFQFIPIRNLSPDKQGRQRLGQRSVLQPLLWHRLLLLQLLLGGGWGAVLGRVQRALWCLLVLLRRGDGGQWVLS